MNEESSAGRWPPVYDWQALTETIERLTQEGRLTEEFYDDPKPERPQFCQGDVVYYDAPIPSLNQDAEPVAHNGSRYWSILSNTCDMDRSLDKVQYWQLFPLIHIGTETTLNTAEKSALCRYQYYRRFFYPAWAPAVAGEYYVADFTRPVTTHSQSMVHHASVEARLQQYAWYLYHSCLVRYLARDDGRND